MNENHEIDDPRFDGFVKRRGEWVKCADESCSEPVHHTEGCYDCRANYCPEHLVTRWPDMERLIYIAQLVAESRCPVTCTDDGYRRTSVCRLCWDEGMQIEICRVCGYANSAHWREDECGRQWVCKHCGEWSANPDNLMKSHPNVFSYLKENGLCQYFVTSLEVSK